MSGGERCSTCDELRDSVEALREDVRALFARVCRFHHRAAIVDMTTPPETMPPTPRYANVEAWIAALPWDIGPQVAPDVRVLIEGNLRAFAEAQRRGIVALPVVDGGAR